MCLVEEDFEEGEGGIGEDFDGAFLRDVGVDPPVRYLLGAVEGGDKDIPQGFPTPLGSKVLGESQPEVQPVGETLDSLGDGDERGILGH